MRHLTRSAGAQAAQLHGGRILADGEDAPKGILCRGRVMTYGLEFAATRKQMKYNCSTCLKAQRAEALLFKEKVHG